MPDMSTIATPARGREAQPQASGAVASGGASAAGARGREAVRGMSYEDGAAALAPDGAIAAANRPDERRSRLPVGEDDPFDDGGVKVALTNRRFVGESKLAEVMAGKSVVRRGAAGGHVRKLQAALEDLGHQLPAKHADAAFGGETETGVKRFQEVEVEGAHSVGVVDQPTMQRLDVRTPQGSEMRHGWREADVDGRRPKRADKETPHLEMLNPRFQGDSVLALLLTGTGAITSGTKRPHVWKIQEALKDLGFGLKGAEPGTFDAATRAGVRAFQEAYNVLKKAPTGEDTSGFKEDGVVGGSTMAALDVYAPRTVPVGGLAPAEGDAKRPKYEKLFEDGRLDVTIALGQDAGATSHVIDRSLAGKYLVQEMGFKKEPQRPSLPSELNMVGFNPDDVGENDTQVFAKQFIAKTTGKNVEVKVKLLAPNAKATNGERIRDKFRESLETDDVTMYSGHARAGTGPDFDPTTSSAGNYKMGPGYDAGYNAGLAKTDNQLDKTKFSDKEQLWMFSACQSQNYKPHMDKTLAKQDAPVRESKSIIYTSKDVDGQAGIFGTLAVLRGLIAEESNATIADLLDVSQRTPLARITPG